MKLQFILLLSLLCISPILAQQSQERALILVNTEHGKQIVIKENKRVRVKTLDGEKYKGRMQIINNDSIKVGYKVIPLEHIEKIKRNPLLQTILIDGTLILYGSFAVGISLIVYPFLQEAVYHVVLMGAAFIGVGVLSPNLLKGYKPEKGWKFQLQS
mgnify:CR=1 FL=1